MRMSSTRLSIQTVRCLAGGVAAANCIEVAADCDPAARITHAMRLSAYPHWPIDRVERSGLVRHRTARVSCADYDSLRSAAQGDARAAGLGKPHEFSARDGARIVVGEGARDTARCDCVVDACWQDVKGRAPVQ
jgi:hypothetical protein